MSPATPLRVSVVGAGIGGLAAAIALRRSGHLVQIFEASEAKREVGAGIGLQVNALRVLEHLGVRRENLRGVDYDGITNFDSETGEGAARPWLIADVDQNRSILCHRADVHNELKRIACDNPGPGTPAELLQGRRVIDCNPDTGSITLGDGSVVVSDLVIAADGVHSTLRAKVLGYPQPALASGISCFRTVFDARKLDTLSDPEWFTAGTGVSGLRGILVKDSISYKLIAAYYCRDKTVVNVAAVYEDPTQDAPEWSPAGSSAELLQTYPTLHPKFRAFIALAEHDQILKWRLRVLPALPTWTRGRTTLLGDAAHATLPTLGQGAALAIEEAGALGCLFPPGTQPQHVQERLKAFQKLRKPRADFVNREAISQVMEPEKRGLYLRSPELQAYLVSHNAIKEAQEYFATLSRL
ncbi:FAD/NAD(P)-binding domain-containing protein [Mycena indigotica]|uniref:FAD/NAD(P)-binding domain-containing protein n=1 Tax=Mycena indigotica TaxID=2126181 RepID=A0A8H6WF96_9AGAR|nr:FAD/NAD(P)-binding domain-containing protein [Mycena indigotica]KAF7312663.1 FAD/NAD(P)-binding domain-containing protein [Mycena indigotica]